MTQSHHAEHRHEYGMTRAPGLMASDTTTSPLRGFLGEWFYRDPTRTGSN